MIAMISLFLISIAMNSSVALLSLFALLENVNDELLST